MSCTTPLARRLSHQGGKYGVRQFGRRRGMCLPPRLTGSLRSGHRTTVEQNVDAVTCPSLNVPEPQMENQRVEVLQKIYTLTSQQVIEVPKIFPNRVPQRRVECRPPQMAEQLMEVPTEPGYALAVLASKVFSRRELLGFLSGQDSTASVVDNPVPQSRGGGGARGCLQGSRARQNSSAANVEQIVDNPARRVLPDFLPGQAQLPHRVGCLTMQMREVKGFFVLFPRPKKSAKLCPHSGSELSVDFTPSTPAAYEVSDGVPMWDDEDGNTWAGSTCSAVIILCGGMLQSDDMAWLCFQSLGLFLPVVVQRQVLGSV